MKKRIICLTLEYKSTTKKIKISENSLVTFVLSLFRKKLNIDECLRQSK